MPIINLSRVRLTISPTGEGALFVELSNPESVRFTLKSDFTDTFEKPIPYPIILTNFTKIEVNGITEIWKKTGITFDENPVGRTYTFKVTAINRNGNVLADQPFEIEVKSLAVETP